MKFVMSATPATTDQELFKRLEYRAHSLWVPKLKIVPKSTSTLMLAINAVFNLIKGSQKKDWFLCNFWTTVGYTIYPPVPRESALYQWWTLAHELVHCLQAQKWARPLFGYLYLWPISQGVLLLLTCWVPVFWASGWSLALWVVGWLVVAGIHFIPQIPDPWRSRWELEAFYVSMWCENYRKGFISDGYVNRLVELFVGMSYYVMEPRRNNILKKLKEAQREIHAGKHPVENHPVVVELKSILGS